MPFEKKCECVGAEATFCTNEKLTRIDKKKKSRLQSFRNCRGWAFKAQVRSICVCCIKHAEVRYASVFL